ncbi:hypothetical protein [Afipia clevelandensis]|uniref:Cytochrome c domain-containing protein n=1 Tax=Afipia clevelandensis ATCC 49720 TaxID=883079 RepID=K8PIG8_9BRAD|nr:hypothetical protein [Afipia clevelandensis]EKS42442.1 hypothetical protein HMPREF9696_00607 [Afipia clevelandensis ATCC 49720]
MLSRALILAAVAFAFGCFGAIPATAQNLEAGKPPSQIFSSTCSLCHKSSRGLLKTVSPGSLPGFLRQHYTTSSDMASAMSAYVLSNGAANAAPGGNLTRQGQEAAGGRPGQEPGPDHAKGRKPAREAAKPDADGRKQAAEPDAQTARQKAAAERRAARQAAREAARAAKHGLPPKNEARHEQSTSEQPATAAKSDARSDSGPDDKKPEADRKPDVDKAEPSQDSGKSDTAKVEGTRPDPVPAVTPAPKEAEKPAEVAVAPPKEAAPAGPLTIDIGPAPASKPVVSAGSPPVPAGNPIPPISR